MVISEEESGTPPDPTNRHKAAGQLASPRLPDVPVGMPMAYRDFLSVSRNDWRGRWDAWCDLSTRGLAGGVGRALRGAEGAEPCRAEPSRAGPGRALSVVPLSCRRWRKGENSASPLPVRLEGPGGAAEWLAVQGIDHTLVCHSRCGSNAWVS